MDALSSPIKFLSQAEKRGKQLQSLGVDDADAMGSTPFTVGREDTDKKTVQAGVDNSGGNAKSKNGASENNGL